MYVVNILQGIDSMSDIGRYLGMIRKNENELLLIYPIELRQH